MTDSFKKGGKTPVLNEQFMTSVNISPIISKLSINICMLMFMLSLFSFLLHCFRMFIIYSLGTALNSNLLLTMCWMSSMYSSFGILFCITNGSFAKYWLNSLAIVSLLSIISPFLIIYMIYDQKYFVHPSVSSLVLSTSFSSHPVHRSICSGTN